MLKRIALLAIIRAAVAYGQLSDCGDLTVHVQPTTLPGPAYLAYAERQAGQILATAGVHLRWTTAMPSDSDNLCGPPILIRFPSGEPRISNPRALAYSVPLNTQVGNIDVFWDRVTKASARNLCPLPNLLAHVLAHEIVHVLEAVAYHAPTGLMREAWTYQDYFEMLRDNLRLTPTDVFLVHSGIASRAASVPRSILASNPSTESRPPLKPHLSSR